MKTKVLALGYIPKGKGGRQVSGLATGLFDLHNAVNELQFDIQVYIAATDVFEKKKQIDSTVVLGWSNKLLILHAIKRFYRLPYFIILAFSLLKYKPIASYARDFVKILFLDYAIDEVKPDYIHLHGCYYALFAKMIWKKRIPVLLRLHGINGFDSTILHYQVYRAIEKAITPIHFHHVTFVTTAICEEWKEKYGAFDCPMTPIINGYNPKVFHPSAVESEKKFDLVTIAGLSERKGQMRVMEAMKMCKDDSIELSYVIVGDHNTEYGGRLRQYAEDNHLDVIFTGYLTQQNANKYLLSSKFFIQPSASEGFGKVYIESIGAGVPVILPKHLPIVQEKNILTNENAILTDDESAESIYRVLKTISSGNKRYDQQQLVESVSHLKWENIAKQYIKLYGQSDEGN